VKRGEVSTQVTAYDLRHEAKEFLDPATVPGLGTFLRGGAPRLALHCLRENERSTAFDTDSLLAGAGQQDASQVAELRLADGRDGDLAVTAAVWNCTGNLVGATFAHPDASEGWASRGLLAAWNMQLESREPEVVVEVDAGLTCLCFHPTRKQVVAAGTVTGEVLVLDLAEADPGKRVVARTTLQSEAHTEAVTGVSWKYSLVEQMRSGKGSAYQVVSASTDGQVLSWHPENLGAPADRLVVVQGGAEVGIACAHVGRSDAGGSADVAVGSEAGRVLVVELRDREAGQAADAGRRETRAPKTAHGGHAGPATAVEWSPFSERILLSSGSDGNVQVLNTVRAQPVVAFSPCAGGVTCAGWSPFRESVVAVGTGDGATLLFDLSRGVRRPAAEVRPGAAAEEEGRAGPVRAVAFNRMRRELIATAQGRSVHVWALPLSLTRRVGSDARMISAVERGDPPGGMFRPS